MNAAAVALEKIVVVTHATRLDQLVTRFNTRNQARFYIEHNGGDFTDYVREDDAYRKALDVLLPHLAATGAKTQTVPRDLLSTFLFTERDLVVTVGGNGLVVNTAKYALGHPIVAINPEPTRFEGVLLPFGVPDGLRAVQRVLEGRARERQVTLAEARTDDGQSLLAFNDFFVGARTHVSARYRLTWDGRTEHQSSSGILVSTGAGSTGWLSSVFNMTAGVLRQFGHDEPPAPLHLAWDDPRLCFVVREPFINKRASASLVAGLLPEGTGLVVESLMPGVGTIFSDGVEDDFIAFNSGMRVHLGAARRKARLVWT